MAADSNERDDDRSRADGPRRHSGSRDSRRNDQPSERGSRARDSKPRDSKPGDSASRGSKGSDSPRRSDSAGGFTNRRSQSSDSNTRSNPRVNARDTDAKRGQSARTQRRPDQAPHRNPHDESDAGTRLGGDLGGSFGLRSAGAGSNRPRPTSSNRTDRDKVYRGRPERSAPDQDRPKRDGDRREGKGEYRGRSDRDRPRRSDRERPRRSSDQDQPRRSDQDRPRRADAAGSRSGDRWSRDRPGRPERTSQSSDRTDRYSDRTDRYADRDERPVRERPSGSRIRPEDDGHVWPEIPEWADRHNLGGAVLADLRGLSKEGSEFVAGHLVAAGELADSDPEQAWEHARAARAQGGRIAVVRETVGLVAYRAGQWSDAITELRAARRMAGGPGLVAVMADAQRALGKPERAIEMAKGPEAAQLEPAAAAELTIVVSGARSDLGQNAAALVGLRTAVREVDPKATFAHRLYYAYAALLAETGDQAEALTWFIRAADADYDDETDAAERAEDLSNPSGANEL